MLKNCHLQLFSTFAHKLRIGQELGVDPEVILATSHGRRSIDVLREYDPSKATMERMYLETKQSKPRTHGITRRPTH
jgi:glycerol 3-phosphatase-1